jgi:sarcosine oxidase subunit gamma
MNPQTLTYRSPVYRKLRDLDARFVEINGYAVASTIGEAATQIDAARQLSLCDLSGLARLGVKGPGTSEWITEQGLTVPEESNRALRQSDSTLLARLAPNEVLILDDVDQQSMAVEGLSKAWHGVEDPAAAPRGFIVPRQDSLAWFRITGDKTASTLAKLCGVDLRAKSFDILQVAQTSVARLNAIVIRDDLVDVHAFHLLADSASAEYWWECLLDAGAEHDLRVVGLDALRELKRG